MEARGSQGAPLLQAGLGAALLPSSCCLSCPELQAVLPGHVALRAITCVASDGHLRSLFVTVSNGVVKVLVH